MKKYISLLAIALVLCGSMVFYPSVSSAAGTTYYVDSSSGSDGNDGTSTSTAWKTLAKVNGTTFVAGDKILFKAGGAWTGTLYPKGSGASGSPIIIDMYGTGNKPLIAGEATVDYALHLHNQQYWEINNLEITNDGATTLARKWGVLITGRDAGTLNNIYLKKLNVHNIVGSGVVQGGTESVRIGVGGIAFQITGNTTPTNWNNIVVDGNTIGPNIQYYGVSFMSTWNGGSTTFESESGMLQSEATSFYPSDNLRITNNNVISPGNAGIMPSDYKNVLIENNIVSGAGWSHGNVPIWWQRSTGTTTVQGNEVYNTQIVGGDSQAFDHDLNTAISYIQYNYSHDNGRGMYFACAIGTAPDVTVRYNISQNDGGSSPSFGYDHGAVFTSACGSTNNGTVKIYNNTVYMGAGNNSKITSNWDNATASSSYLSFMNNIFYSGGDLGWDPKFMGSADNNNYYGGNTVRSDDLHAIKADPMLVNPGSGGIGKATVDGYKLQPGSPLINAGASINNNGLRDYWGTALYYNGAADVGAYEYASGTLPAAPVNLALNKTATAISAQDASHAASSGVDGNVSTSWIAANGNANNWWKVDLRRNYQLTGSQIVFLNSNFAWKYKVEVSADDLNWTQVADFTTNTNTAQVQAQGFQAIARYVRVTFTETPGTNWTAFSEFQVLGEPLSLALNKTATASSQQDSTRDPSKAVDGNTATMWVAANGNANNWWKVDLGQNYNLTSSEIEFQDQRLWKYKIEVSTDDTNWTLVADRTANTSTDKIQTQSFTATARYVKVTVTQTPSPAWTAFAEFKVFGEPLNLALNKTATAISQQDSTRDPSKAVDGNTATMWIAANGNANNWWKVDLGQNYNLTSSEIEFQDQRLWKYKIEVSTDNTNWTLVADRTANTSTDKIQTQSFTATARYVKVTVTQTPSPAWTAFAEFRVFDS
ncbi:discoidin domain-containing protein [Cohnella silvisoli]|uniref:Discoidin domain-containing protein n=1 Tax=Cohnella silvisoli TaxID=2873699 RepID=A0ABV1L2F3_9BACL|nr:discoidin domain-containing protein [Cohnella silvisoli]MCD9025426.1 discoidin domain-containing protein [Cohnella silvisoli]